MMLSNRLFKASAQKAGYSHVSPAASSLTQTLRPFFSSFTGTNTDAPAAEESEKKKPIISFRKDIAAVIAEEHEMSMAQSERVLTTVLDTITESVVENKRVQLSNFGSFQSMYSKERNSRNPSTGEILVIPAKQRVSFKPYKAFKASVNK